MHTLLDALYTYAQEQKLPGFLSAHWADYRRAAAEAEQLQSRLAQSLPQESAALFTRFLDRWADIHDLEGLALLCSGISIGLELGRL